MWADRRAGGKDGAGFPGGTPGPLRVAVVDLAADVEDLDCRRDEDPRYVGAWILVCRAGRPLGSVVVPLKGTRIPSAVLLSELHDRFRDSEAPQPERADVRLPTASVIVCTDLSRPALLQRCLKSLSTLDYPDYEVIVVDNRPGDAPSVNLAGTQVVRESRPGLSTARNRGLRAARGDIIAFTDDDVEADPRWLRALAERLIQEPDAAAVTGLAVPSQLETPAQVWFEESRKSDDRCFVPLTFVSKGRFGVVHRSTEDGSERVYSLYAMGERGSGWNMAFRTAVLRDMGGFDEALGAGTRTFGGEDLAVITELLTSGHVVAYEPSAIVFHTHRDTFAELMRQRYGYGVGLTAMLTSIALRNPWHFLGLALVAPRWLQSVLAPDSGLRSGGTSDYPRKLVWAELRGMFVGPFAYLRGRRPPTQWRVARRPGRKSGPPASGADRGYPPS